MNLRSVTEEDSLQAFFSDAQLADTKFQVNTTYLLLFFWQILIQNYVVITIFVQAEKLNAIIVNPKVGCGVLSKEEYAQYEKNKIEKKIFLKIPRRYALLQTPFVTIFTPS